MATMQEVKDKAKARRSELYAEYLASGEKNYRQFALKKKEGGEGMTVVRYWQMLSKAAKEAAVE